MNSELELTPSDSGNTAAAAAAGRRFLGIYIACLVVAILVLVAVVSAFVLKDSPVGLVGSSVAFVAFFVTFQILVRKRRTYLTRWTALKRDA
jgi:uncharacterized membrane protein YkgB